MVRQLEASSAAPDHDTNRHPVAPTAVRHTFVPLTYEPPAGFAVTVPPADGDALRVSVYTWTNVAVTAAFAVMVRQFEVSSAAPDHDTNRHPVAATAVRHTFVPLEYEPPGGFAVTVPAADGDAFRVSVYSCANVAVTAAFAVIVRQLEVSSAAPDHDTNRHPVAAAAVRHTFVPLTYGPPGGVAVTVPPAVGDAFRVSVYTCANVAVTAAFAVIVRQFEASSAVPDHDTNRHPVAATAVRHTFVPLKYEAPAGFAVTVPPAAGDALRVSVYTWTNVAVTAAFAVMVRQFEPSSTAPDQDTKCQPAAAAAVRHTFVPLTYDPPAGFAVTAPPADGDALRVSVYTCAKVAVTTAFAVMVRQFEGSSTAPDQDTNCQPVAAAGVRHTLVPLTYEPPGGFAVTVPPADGDALRVSAYTCAKVAVTAAFAVMVRQFEASSTAPDHDTNCQPAAAAAVRHTFVPLTYEPPGGFAVTVPPDDGDALRVSVYTCPNIAVTAAFAVIVRQFEASSAAPDQDTNCQPAAATAVRHTFVPLTYGPPTGLAVTVPPADGDALRVRV